MNYRGLNIPFVSFGTVTSDNLFDEKEQALFDFYEQNKERYQKALDIGANIGVHSILMARQRWFVQSYEPDADHMKMMIGNIYENLPDWLAQPLPVPHRKAVSDHDGRETFVRVKGNTTGSHLKGDKKPYGELEEFEVDVVDCRPLFAWADFAKIDCEGHEARLLLTVTPETKCEFMVEVGNEKNARAIWEHFATFPVELYSQKRGWEKCRGVSDLPMHHSEGALFIGRKPPFG
jgi:FkbM family methyltransferase